MRVGKMVHLKRRQEFRCLKIGESLVWSRNFSQTLLVELLTTENLEKLEIERVEKSKQKSERIGY